jgi:hypothetical protein
VTEGHQSRVLMSALYPLTDVAKIFWLNPQDKFIPGFWTKYTGSYAGLAKNILGKTNHAYKLILGF